MRVGTLFFDDLDLNWLLSLQALQLLGNTSQLKPEISPQIILSDQLVAR